MWVARGLFSFSVHSGYDDAFPEVLPNIRRPINKY